MVILKRSLAISIFAAFSFVSVLSAQQGVGSVEHVEGRVMVKRHNNDGTAMIATFEAKEDDPVHEKDVLEVSLRSSVDIKLKNGTQISLGPNTAFRFYRYSLYNLLYGNVRVNIGDEEKKALVKLYAPNVVVGASKADFVVSYDNNKKSSMVACLDGKVAVAGMASSLAADEYMEVRTSYEAEKEISVNSDPAKMSRSYKSQVIESFNADYSQSGPDEFTRIRTSLLRFAPGFDHTKFHAGQNSFSGFSFAYLPLIHIFSIFYIEPYLFLSVRDIIRTFM
jgi:hypothetical protein